MTSRSPAPMVAVPAVLAVLAAVPTAALAATQVSVRVEGAKSTLLPERSVTAPTSGSITKGGAPAGTCPATSAAGALQRATRGRWGGSYSSGLGIEVNTILGTTLSYAKGSYWGFFVDDRFASKGVCDTKLTPGESLLFAAVPAKGKTPLPIVVRAPRRATDGHAFDVRTFVYSGAGSATKPVSDVRFRLAHGGDGTVPVKIGRDANGVTRFTPSGTGTLSLVASAPGEIRSAAFTVTLSK